MKLLLILAILCMVGVVSATDEYEVSITVSYPSNLDDITNSTWLPFGTYVVTKGESENVMDSKIELIDVSVQTNTALIEVLRDGDRYPNVMKVSESVIVDETVKITLNDIRKKTIGDGVITDCDTVVSIWIEPNSLEKLGLEEGGVNSYNPIEYGKTAGWSTSGNTELVTLSIEKREDFGGILVIIDGGEWEEVTSGNTDRRLFELNDNAEYSVQIHYEMVDFWGGKTDEEEIYTLKITGLEVRSGAVGVSSGLLGSYSKEESTNIRLVTGVDGNFQEFSGATVTSEGQNSEGNYVWNVIFDSAGTKRLTFVSDSGSEGYFDFSISAKQESTSDTVSSRNDDSNNSLGYIIFGLLLLGGIVMLIVTKKKGKPKASVGPTSYEA
ncbi:MAG: hypothetical protein KAS32_17315 [Candidatus Peribacteraceae bacterium]|nr:hypothetical protein [Candidatus Peribacteraceae bacterium]